MQVLIAHTNTVPLLEARPVPIVAMNDLSNPVFWIQDIM